LRFPLCLLALIVLACCGADEQAGSRASSDRVVDGTLHVLTLNRLQGYAEGIPCDPADIPPLVAAAQLRGDLLQAGAVPLLVAVGDTLVPTKLSDAVSKVRPLRLPLQARGRAILEALSAAQVDVYVPGKEDLAASPLRLFDSCVELGVPVLISNLQQPDRPDVKRSMVVTAGTLRIGLLAILPPNLAASKDAISLEGVIPCAKRLARSLREEQQVDLVVVFSNLTAKTNTTILAEVEGVDIIIGSTDEGAQADRVLIVGSTAVVSSAATGQEIGHTTVSIRGGKLSMTDLSPRNQLPGQIDLAELEWVRYVRTYGTSDPLQLARLISPGDEAYFLRQVNLIEQNREALIELNEFVGSYIEQRAAGKQPAASNSPVLAALQSQGAAVNRALALPSLPAMPPQEEIINIPSATDCQDCHQQQFRFWESTSHAKAYETLTTRNRGRDPTCLECHTTGYQDPAGWVDPRADAPLGGVTCFSCHSATTVHSTSRRRVVDPLYVVGDADRITCIECHTVRRSPEFDRTALLASISCPPMRVDDPAIARARQDVIDAITIRRKRGVDESRDNYLEARALLGLSRDDQGFELLADVATENADDPRLALEIAELFDQGERSGDGLDSLRNYLFLNTGDPDVNVAYVKLLIEAREKEARDPAQALAHLSLILPDDSEESDHAYLDLRVLQIDALFALGRSVEGLRLIWSLNRQHGTDPRLIALIERYTN
jgi:hypothetical protein